MSHKIYKNIRDPDSLIGTVDNENKVALKKFKSEVYINNIIFNYI